jgi:hypothetical protein
MDAGQGQDRRTGLQGHWLGCGSRRLGGFGKMVYVDNMNAPYGNMVMCHLLADTREELLEMVDRIGVQRKWIQYKGTYLEHFDIALSKKKLAIQAGAKEIEYGRELAEILERKKKRMEKKK